MPAKHFAFHALRHPDAVLVRLISTGLALFILLASALGQDAGKGLVMVIIGPPGSGKTTQAEFLKQKYKIAVLSADELRRKAGNSEAGLNDLLRQRVKHQNAVKGFVLDGYPTTRKQADFLGKLVSELKLPAPIVLQLDVPDDVVRERLAKRDGKKYIESKVESELARYHKEMDFIRTYYPQADIWTLIGTRTPREVFNTIVTLVENRR